MVKVKCTCHKENGASATTMWFDCPKHKESIHGKI